MPGAKSSFRYYAQEDQIFLHQIVAEISWIQLWRCFWFASPSLDSKPFRPTDPPGTIENQWGFQVPPPTGSAWLQWMCLRQQFHDLQRHLVFLRLPESLLIFVEDISLSEHIFREKGSCLSQKGFVKKKNIHESINPTSFAYKHWQTLRKITPLTWTKFQQTFFWHEMIWNV